MCHPFLVTLPRILSYPLMQLNNNLKIRISLLAAALLLLTVGGWIYCFFRPHVLLLHVLIDKLPCKPLFDKMGEWCQNWQLPEFVVYNLPGALWTLSYLLVVEAIFLSKAFAVRIHWAAAIPLIGVVSECLQALNILPGHFDAWDLCSYLVPFLVYAVVPRRT